MVIRGKRLQGYGETLPILFALVEYCEAEGQDLVTGVWPGSIPRARSTGWLAGYIYTVDIRAGLN